MEKYFLNLFGYEHWANNAITYALVKIEELPPKALSIMSHIVDAQIVWLSRIKSIDTHVRVWEDYTIEEISGKLEQSSTDLIGFLKSISGDDTKKIISYKNSKGEEFRSTLEDILTHLIIHSAYHRGQIILLIKPFVSVLPYTDYIHYVRAVRDSSD
ncbi:MAG: DinB family protein [Ignavibacteria bacterium]